jgi:hypothetical protein
MDTNTVKEIAVNTKTVIDALTVFVMAIISICTYIGAHWFTSRKKK